MSTLLAILLNILVAAVLYIILNRKIDNQLNPKEMLDRIRDEVEDIIKELNHTTDRNIGLIEDRIEVLKSVLDTADRRLSVLRREAEKHEMSSAVYSSILKRNRGPAPKDETVRPEPEVSANPEPSEPAGAANEEPDGKQGRSRGDFKAQVLDLHRKGIAPSIIAGRVGSTLGEVELIIALQGGRTTGSSDLPGEGSK